MCVVDRDVNGKDRAEADAVAADAHTHEGTVCGRVGGSTGSAEDSRAGEAENDEGAARRAKWRMAGMSEDEIDVIERDLASMSANGTLASTKEFWAANPTPSNPESMIEFLTRQIADSEGRNAANRQQLEHQSALVASLQEQCSNGRAERGRCQQRLLKEKLQQKKGGRAS